MIQGARSPVWRSRLAVAVILFVLAAIVGVDITRMAAPLAVGVGPTPAMRLVALLLVVLGIAHLVSAWRSRRLPADPVAEVAENAQVRRGPFLWVLSGLIGTILIIGVGAGFIAGSTWLFTATARAFGQPIRLKSPAIGLTLAVLVYVFFTQALTLSLPAGPLERLLLH